MRLIDADRLLDRCKFYHLPNGDLAVPIIDVQHAPTIEPKRKKGEWIENSPVTEKCDQCGYVIRDWFVSQFNFCPNCGAFMMEDDGK